MRGWPSFREKHILVGKHVMDATHRIRGSYIRMPSYTIDILSDLRITQFVDDPAPKIVVMVEDPDLGIQRCSFQSGTQVKRYENHFVLLRPNRRREMTVLVRVYLIIDRNSPNFDLGVSIRL